ncbi:MAG TPA: Clp protease N-terminal domain-containing protein, partial [Candidatus Limnocylindrales bacterium]|nr:Clp protease N-terminal domain-containing protein [Candidatus Limnocylindrales bacterium]
MTTPPHKFPEKDIRLRCGRLISPAAEEARALNHPYIGVEHLFMALTRREQSAVSRLLRRASLSPRIVRTEIRREVGTGEGPQGDVLPLTPRAEMVLSIATFSADHDQNDDVSDSHLLLAMLQEGESVPVRKLTELGFDIDYWLNVLLHEIYQHNLSAQGAASLFEAMNELDDSDEEIEPPARKPVPGERTPTPLLDKYGRDLNVQAAEGKIGPVIARESELRTLARTLARSKKNNPLLLG